MKGSRKSEGPPEFREWLKKETDDWKPSYPFNEKGVRLSVKWSLLVDQRGLCVYCGRKLKLDRPGETYHVEHFRPQSLYSGLQVAYSNLYLSCGQRDDAGQPAQTCGNFKGEWFDETSHVDPAYNECTLRFRFTLNGGINAATDGDAAAEEMIKRVNLNHPELVKERKQVLAELDFDEDRISDYWDDDAQMAESHAHIAFQHLGMTIP